MDLHKLEQRIGYNFKNQSILRQCLTHPSINAREKNYERLEFLGDAVLNFVITEFLVKEYNSLNEGDLAKKRSYLVSGHLAAEIARKIGLGEFIIMSHSEQKSGGADNDANLENVTEALIGSIYLDSGIEKVRQFVLEFWKDYLTLDFSDKDTNPKSYLQEWSLERGLGLPVYQIVSQSGFAHMPIFEIEVHVGHALRAKAMGRSKKEAEVAAAKNLIEKIK
jgi:ribonuclease-3